MKPIFKTIAAASVFCCSMLSAFAQSLPAIDLNNLRVINPNPKVQLLKSAAAPAKLSQAASANNLSAANPSLKIFQYSFTSPRDGNLYSGSIVGTDPRLVARATNVEVVLIPLRIELTNSAGVVFRRFDPTSPDTGCLGGNVTDALSNTLASPLFSPVPNYMINGVNMGNTSFIDAFQRAQFWQNATGGALVSAKPGFHLNLTTTVAPKQTISLVDDVNGSAAAFTFAGDCGANNAAEDNPKAVAVVDINLIDAKLNDIIANLNLSKNKFAFFVTYRTYMSEGAPGDLSQCCYLGYHSADYASPANPGQTYGIAVYDNVLFEPDISVLSHELLEWINDPSGFNLVPAWGNTGQVGSGCQDNLETGDPFSGTYMPGVMMPNGVTYHAQENAFFSWFMGPVFTGAGGKFSSNGSFTQTASACNQ
ncbi:hypothetical protein AAKU67_003894 [Oxalobacteraceae bacterium GrIS 2.11]